MEKKMETPIVYWGNMGIKEKKLEAMLFRHNKGECLLLYNLSITPTYSIYIAPVKLQLNQG